MTRRRAKAPRKRRTASTPGPKPGPPERKRSRKVQILVTRQVDARITAAAKAAGLSRSDWGAAALERALDAAPPGRVIAPAGATVRYHGDDMKVGDGHPMLPPGARVTSIDPTTGAVTYEVP